MREFCARCGAGWQSLISSRVVLRDNGGLEWRREKIRCPKCGFVDFDYISREMVDTPPLAPPQSVREGNEPELVEGELCQREQAQGLVARGRELAGNLRIAEKIRPYEG